MTLETFKTAVPMEWPTSRKPRMDARDTGPGGRPRCWARDTYRTAQHRVAPRSICMVPGGVTVSSLTILACWAWHTSKTAQHRWFNM